MVASGGECQQSFPFQLITGGIARRVRKLGHLIFHLEAMDKNGAHWTVRCQAKAAASGRRYSIVERSLHQP